MSRKRSKSVDTVYNWSVEINRIINFTRISNTAKTRKSTIPIMERADINLYIFLES